MILHFTIDFKTGPDEALFISGNLPELGSGSRSKAVRMDGKDGEWQLSLDYKGRSSTLEYHYFVRKGDEAYYEAGGDRVVELNQNKCREMYMFDSWQGNDSGAPFLTAPFASVFFRGGNRPKARYCRYGKEIVIRVTRALVKEGETVSIIGSHPMLGSWDPSKGLPLEHSAGSRWEIHLPAEQMGDGFEYRFAVGQRTEGEEHNRKVTIPPMQKGTVICYEHSSIGIPDEKPAIAGCSASLRQLRTKNSWGIGSIPDICSFADWCSMTGQKAVRLTAEGTACAPWSPISTMALDPIYLDPFRIYTIEDESIRKAFEQEREALNSAEESDMARIADAKERYFQHAYNRIADEVFAEPDFQEFVSKNKEWLLPYAAFSTFSDAYGTSDSLRWKEDYRCETAKIAKMYKSKDERGRRMRYHVFLQYQLHLQMEEAAAYVRSLGISLQCELPLTASAGGADVWSEEKYFIKGFTAGTQPSADTAGSADGFAVYNRRALEEDGYSFIRKMLRRASAYFDTYCLTRIEALNSTWALPCDQTEPYMGVRIPYPGLDSAGIRAAGFDFDPARDTVPSFDAETLEEMFGDDSHFVRETFLNGKGEFRLEFSKQRYIREWFERYAPQDMLRLEKQVTAMAGEVLFIRDPFKQNCYQPRACAQDTMLWKNTDASSREAFLKICARGREESDMEGLAFTSRMLSDIIAATGMLACASFSGSCPECLKELVTRLNIPFSAGKEEDGAREILSGDDIIAVVPARKWLQEDARTSTGRIQVEHLMGNGGFNRMISSYIKASGRM